MDEFKLKNYTTSVSVLKSIMEIESLLSKFGASRIVKDYLSDGTINCLSFKLGDRGYKLPANIEGVKQVLTGNKRNSYIKDAMKKREEQAQRTAWRIIKDWLHAQLSLIKSGQAEPEQLLLPYMFDGKQTLYEKLKQTNYQIEAPKEERRRIIITECDTKDE